MGARVFAITMRYGETDVLYLGRSKRSSEMKVSPTYIEIPTIKR